MDDYSFMDPRMQNMQPMGMQPMGMQPMGMQPMGMQPMGMQPMGMYDDQNRMMVEQQLEKMYPRLYYIVSPVVNRHCDMFDNSRGPSYCPTKEEAEQMIDNILMDVEAPVNAEFESEEYEKDNNSEAMPVINTHGDPFGNPRGRRNPFLRGLVGTLLISELLGRRRRHGFRRFPGQFSPFFPGFFPGFFPFFPGPF